MYHNLASEHYILPCIPSAHPGYKLVESFQERYVFRTAPQYPQATPSPASTQATITSPSHPIGGLRTHGTLTNCPYLQQQPSTPRPFFFNHTYPQSISPHPGFTPHIHPNFPNTSKLDPSSSAAPSNHSSHSPIFPRTSHQSRARLAKTTCNTTS